MQSQINEEFQRVIELPTEVSARLAHGIANSNSSVALTAAAGGVATGANGHVAFAQRVDDPALA